MIYRLPATVIYMFCKYRARANQNVHSGYQNFVTVIAKNFEQNKFFKTRDSAPPAAHFAAM